MKTVKSLADATRLAAATGATLDLGDRVVNVGGAKLALASTRGRPAPLPEPPPAPAPVPAGVTADEVRRMLDERDASWRALVDAQQRQIDFLTAVTQVEKPRPSYRIQAAYDDQDRLVDAVITPEP